MEFGLVAAAAGVATEVALGIAVFDVLLEVFAAFNVFGGVVDVLVGDLEASLPVGVFFTFEVSLANSRLRRSSSRRVNARLLTADARTKTPQFGGQ